MSEQNTPSAGEGEPQARPTTDHFQAYDKDSMKLYLRWLAAGCAVVIGSTLLIEAKMSDDDKKSSVSSPAYEGTSQDQVIENPAPEKKCREVSGVLRIVGVNAKQIETIHDQDDVDQVPHMLHQRDANGDKADIDKFEWRFDEAKAPDVNDSPFYTAARYHFKSYTERSDEPLLNKSDVDIPGNAFNFGPDMIGQIVEFGQMQVCEPIK
ncbi:MAG TPA: hypothetical protein VLA92_03865 [Candidatus Saccharimonadales bacterium]|nr:hypothetical protein [Candidatus Saccharimonadales bacterium]